MWKLRFSPTRKCKSLLTQVVRRWKGWSCCHTKPFKQITSSRGWIVDQSILESLSSKATHKDQILSLRNFTTHFGPIFPLTLKISIPSNSLNNSNFIYCLRQHSENLYADFLHSIQCTRILYTLNIHRNVTITGNCLQNFRVTSVSRLKCTLFFCPSMLAEFFFFTISHQGGKLSFYNVSSFDHSLSVFVAL